MVNDYRCNCKPGYEGRNCEIDIDDCELEQQPCQNGATCLDKVDGYFCECRPGYSGELCEEKIDECELNKCENGGRCESLINTFKCYCRKYLMSIYGRMGTLGKFYPCLSLIIPTCSLI